MKNIVLVYIYNQRFITSTFFKQIYFDKPKIKSKFTEHKPKNQQFQYNCEYFKKSEKFVRLFTWKLRFNSSLRQNSAWTPSSDLRKTPPGQWKRSGASRDTHTHGQTEQSDLVSVYHGLSSKKLTYNQFFWFGLLCYKKLPTRFNAFCIRFCLSPFAISFFSS